MSDLNKKGQDFLAENKDVDTVYLTTDGTPFVSQNYASLHGRSLAKGKQGVTIVKREEQQEDQLFTKADEVIALIEATEDLDLVNTYAAAEAASKKPRKTVTDTIAAKIEDLTKDA
jgi:hypothetical protein